MPTLTANLKWCVQAEPQPETNAVENREENLIFSESPDIEVADTPSLLDPSYEEDADGAASLATFLKRPVLLNTYVWNEGPQTPYLYDFYPWDVYFSDPKVLNKTKNFSRFHGKLHLKFVYNASPFYSGAIRVCYFPLKDYVTSYDASSLVPCSQTPGVWILPQEGTSCELVLPFLHPFNWIDPMLHNDLKSMGKLVYMNYADLTSANEAVGANVTVACYAWIEDAELAGPTTQEALQSGSKKEVKLSNVASTVSTLAGKLSGVPIVGTYASAVAAGSSLVGKVAAAFGFSNEPVLEDVRPFQSKNFHALANCETSIPLDRLCIDPKNAVSLSGESVGLSNEDPLDLGIFMKESFLGSFTWDSTMASQDQLVNLAVTPAAEIYDSTSIAGNTVHYHTPMAYVARMFSFWRGSMIFRIKVIRTPYHRGRLRISWDPRNDNTLDADTETTNFGKILDLDEKDDFEICIPYKSKRMWNVTNFVIPMQANAYAIADSTSINGVVNLRVQNTLTSPSSISAVKVMVFVRPGPDMQFAQPNELPTGYSPWALQSSSQIDDSGSKSGTGIEQCTVGEIVRSLRPLLHRTSLSFAQFLGDPNLTGPGMIHSVNVLPRKPLWFGKTTRGLMWAKNPLAANVAMKFNWCATHPLNWILFPFVGYRGSINIQANILGASNANGKRIESAFLTRYPGSALLSSIAQARNRTSFQVQKSTPSTYSSYVDYVRSNGLIDIPSGQRGCTLTKEVTQSALTASVPQYAPLRFALSYPDADLERIGQFQGSWYDNLRMDVQWSQEGVPDDTASVPMVEVYYSGGVDFQPFFFVCIPPLYTFDVVSPNDDAVPV